MSQIPVPNKPLLKKLIEHLKALGIIEETPSNLILNGFSYVLKFPKEDYMLLLSVGFQYGRKFTRWLTSL